MKILMISDVYFPRINGVSTSILTFRRELEQAGHTVKLLVPDYNFLTDHEANIIRVPSQYLFFDPEDRMMLPRKVLKLKKKLAREKFDIMHIQTPFIAHYAGVRLAKKLGIPRIETYHTFFEEYLHHYLPFVPKFIWRFIARSFSRSQCNNLDRLVVPSSAMATILKDYNIKTKMEIIATGIDLEKFSGGDGERFRKKFGVEKKGPTLVYVGRIAHEKNMEFLIEATARVRQQIPDIQFLIAGEGPAKSHLETKSKKMGLAETVRFVGNFSRRQDLLDCYSTGDAFIFASRTETQGLVVLEAMALGVPVISTAVMGTRDVLADGQGALIAKEDVEDFSQKIIQVLKNPEISARLKETGQSYIQSWSAPTMANKMIRLYEQVIKEKR